MNRKSFNLGERERGQQSFQGDPNIESLVLLQWCQREAIQFHASPFIQVHSCAMPFSQVPSNATAVQFHLCRCPVMPLLCNPIHAGAQRCHFRAIGVGLPRCAAGWKGEGGSTRGGWRQLSGGWGQFKGGRRQPSGGCCA